MAGRPRLIDVDAQTATHDEVAGHSHDAHTS
jgi:hypothetical protein